MTSRFVLGLVFVASCAWAFACGSFSSSEDDATPATTDGGDGSVNGSSSGGEAGDDGASTCSDTSNDPKNCGACGHDCLGGSCVSGKCEPVVLATTTEPVPYLALDATRVIWMTSTPPIDKFGNVYACPRSSGCGAAPTKLASNVKENGFGSDGTTAWTGDVQTGRILKVGVAGLDDAYPSLPGKGGILWLTPRDGGLFVNVYNENDAAPFPRTIYRVDLVEQRYELVADYAPPAANADNTVFTKTHVYVASHNNVFDIAAAPLTGGQFQTVLATDVVSTMTTDGDRVFFADGVGPIYACNGDGKPCGRTTVLAIDPELGGPAHLLAAADGRLFIETAGGKLVSCDPKDCPGTATVLATEQAFATQWHFFGANIAVDTESVYYVAREGAAEPFTYVIKRVAREAT